MDDLLELTATATTTLSNDFDARFIIFIWPLVNDQTARIYYRSIHNFSQMLYIYLYIFLLYNLQHLI